MHDVIHFDMVRRLFGLTTRPGLHSRLKRDPELAATAIDIGRPGGRKKIVFDRKLFTEYWARLKAENRRESQAEEVRS